MKKIVTTIVVSGLLITVSGCETMSQQNVGVLTGGVAGGITG
jgi:hypothetical protein